MLINYSFINHTMDIGPFLIWFLLFISIILNLNVKSLHSKDDLEQSSVSIIL